MNQIHAEGKRLVDEAGRECVFQGINLVDKGQYDENQNRVFRLDWKEEVFEELRDRGFDLIRLGIAWEAAEPLPGQYNEAYLAKINRILDWCGAYGLSVILDMHQDLYATYQPDAPGDGAPSWAVITDDEVYEKPMKVWAEGYFFNAAVHTAFDHFWANTKVQGKGLQDHFTDMWKHVAKRLGGHKAVIGFDIFNEPFPGSSGGEIFWSLIQTLCTVLGEKEGREVPLTDLIPCLSDDAAFGRLLQTFDNAEQYRRVLEGAGELVRVFDTEVYAPFLQKAANAIREVTNKGILFLENCYYSNLGIPCSVPRLKNVKGEPEENIVFAPHGYDLVVDMNSSTGSSNQRVDVIFGEHLKTQKRLDVPVIVGEWGGCSDGDGGLSHIHHLLTLFDENRWGNMYWCYYDGIFSSPLMKVLSRPHPRRVAGKIERFGYDPAARRFELRYQQEAECAQPTELYLPEAPTAVETDGEYTLEPLGKQGAVLLRFLSAPGTHTAAVTFRQC